VKRRVTLWNKKCGSPHQQSHHEGPKSMKLDSSLPCSQNSDIGHYPVPPKSSSQPLFKINFKEKEYLPMEKRYLIFIYLLTEASYLVKDIIALSNAAVKVKLSLYMPRQHIKPMRYSSMH
jgi:hypothetical protein